MVCEVDDVVVSESAKSKGASEDGDPTRRVILFLGDIPRITFSVLVESNLLVCCCVELASLWWRCIFYFLIVIR